MRDLHLAIDVGTNSIRAARVDGAGTILAIGHREHEQIVPRHGWSEQRPADWWEGTVGSVRAVLGAVEDAAARVAALCACGQMHGAVLVDDDGRLMRDTAPLWNDKRTLPQVEAFAARVTDADVLPLAANLPAPAWPAFKLLWLMENDPDAVERAATLLMPDWINLRLTGRRAADRTEASTSFLMDWRARVVGRADRPDRRAEPPAGAPARRRRGAGTSDGGGRASPRPAPRAAGAGGRRRLPGGAPRLRGDGAGMGSDVTGTSTILTLIGDEPALGGGASNVLCPRGIGAP